MSISALPRSRSIFTKAGRYLATLGGILARIARARQRQRAVAALHKLSDYQLRDIGISRSEIIRSVEKGRSNY